MLPSYPDVSREDMSYLTALYKTVHRTRAQTGELSDGLDERPALTALLNRKGPEFEAFKRAAVDIHPACIRFIDEPSPEVQRTAVTKNGNVLALIKEPTQDARLAAVQDKPWAVLAVKPEQRDIATEIRVATANTLIKQELVLRDANELQRDAAGQGYHVGQTDRMGGHYIGKVLQATFWAALQAAPGKTVYAHAQHQLERAAQPGESLDVTYANGKAKVRDMPRTPAVERDR